MRSSVLAGMTFGVLWMSVSGTAGNQPRDPRDPVSRALAFFEDGQVRPLPRS